MQILLDTESETTVIAACLSYPDSVYTVIDQLTPEHFHHFRNRDMFVAIESLVRQGLPVDLITVTEELRKTNKLEKVGGQPGVVEVALCSTSQASLPYTIEAVIRQHKARMLYQSSREIQDKLQANPAIVDELIDSQSALITNLITKRESKPTLLKDLYNDFLPVLEERHSKGVPPGLSTTFVNLDRFVSFIPGEVTLIGARPGMGKTSFVAQILLNQARNNKETCVLYSLEMPSEVIMQRLASVATGIPFSALNTGDLTEAEWQRVYRFREEVEDINLEIRDDCHTLAQIFSSAQQTKAKNKRLGLIGIDYIQLIQTPAKQTRNDEVSEVSRAIKQGALKLGVPVLALSQLNRGVEQRQDKRPNKADLRDSGSLEQDADIILFIYRDDYYNPDSDRKGEAEVIVSKNRNGEQGSVRLGFQGSCTSFHDI